jgi:hypothetical protein
MSEELKQILVVCITAIICIYLMRGCVVVKNMQDRETTVHVK